MSATNVEYVAQIGVDNDKWLMTADGNPTTGDGLPSGVGSWLVTTSGLYQKVGAGHTDWSLGTLVAAAGTLTGTTLAANVVTSSLTTVGVLAAPHMTSPVIDSGGLTVTAGGISITAGTLAAQAITGTTLNLTSTSAATRYNATDISTQYSIGGVIALSRNGDYTDLVDGNNATVMRLGDATDPTNYYDNTAHVFRTRNGAANMVIIAATGLTANAEINLINSSKVSWADGTSYIQRSSNDLNYVTSNVHAFTGAATFNSTVAAGAYTTTDGGTATSPFAYWKSVASSEARFWGQKTGTGAHEGYMAFGDDAWLFYDITNTRTWMAYTPSTGALAVNRATTFATNITQTVGTAAFQAITGTTVVLTGTGRAQNWIATAGLQANGASRFTATHSGSTSTLYSHGADDSSYGSFLFQLRSSAAALDKSVLTIDQSNADFTVNVRMNGGLLNMQGGYIYDTSGTLSLNDDVSVGAALTVATNITQSAGTAALQALTATTATFSGRAIFQGAYSDQAVVAVQLSASVPGVSWKTTSTGRWFSAISNYIGPDSLSFLYHASSNNTAPNAEWLRVDASAGTVAAQLAWTFSSAITGSVTGSSGSTTGNAATATAAQNTRTIWGQNFNLTANVTGNMTGVGTVAADGNYTITKASGSTSAFLLDQNGVVTWTIQNTATTGQFRVAQGAGTAFSLDLTTHAARFYGVATFDGNITQSSGTLAAQAVTGTTLVLSSSATATNYQAGAGNAFFWAGRSSMASPSDGVITLTNNAANGFTRLQFGGTSSSEPALRRNGAVLDVVSADASVWTGLAAGWLTLNTGDLIQASGTKHYLDGGSDSYTIHSASDQVDHYVGGNWKLRLVGGGVILPATLPLYLDGGGDTYVYESAADVLDTYVGSVLATSIAEVGGAVTATFNATIAVTGPKLVVSSLATTASAANVWWDGGASNTFKQSTSRRSAKRNIVPLTVADALEIIHRPAITFQSALPNDDPKRVHLGFILDDADSRVVYGESLAYERYVVPLALIAQDHERRLQKLEKTE